jgi:hypothetical protein
MNPFEVDNKDVLYCLSSGSPTPNDMDVDLLQADKKGKGDYEIYLLRSDLLTTRAAFMHQSRSLTSRPFQTWPSLLK